MVEFGRHGQRFHRIGDQPEAAAELVAETLGHRTQIIGCIDLEVAIGRQHQAPLARALDRDALDLRRAQELVAQHRRDRAARHRIAGKRREVRGIDPVVQPVDAKIRQRRHEDQDFGQHHEETGQDQKLARQSEPAGMRAGPSPPSLQPGRQPSGRHAQRAGPVRNPPVHRGVVAVARQTPLWGCNSNAGVACPPALSTWPCERLPTTNLSMEVVRVASTYCNRASHFPTICCF